MSDRADTPGADDPDGTGLEKPSVLRDDKDLPVVAMGLGVGELFIRAYFPSAKHEIRVLAIGKELNRELGASSVPLHDAVADLVRRIDNGLFVIRDAGETRHPRHPGHIRARFHCKVYNCDDHTAWSGSANLTKSGLRADGNEEQLTRASGPDEVKLFSGRFEKVLDGARDLLAEVRACLWDWLQMSTPFEAYLRALHALYSTQETVGGTRPTYFQEAVIERMCDQACHYRGALALVATGLGKTIIGAEVARRLLRLAAQRPILVLAPG